VLEHQLIREGCMSMSLYVTVLTIRKFIVVTGKRIKQAMDTAEKQATNLNEDNENLSEHLQ